MAQYQLEVLNDKEFEELCKDLLEKETDLKFQIFKVGRDKGIDLRCARNRENEIMVQVKQFGRSTFNNLTDALSEELLKIEKLAHKPLRYILMTAFDTSVGQVDKIVEQMKPWIKTSQDVYGRDRIMNLIQKYPEIEKKYYKLWLTSTNVLKEILHNGVSGRSEFVKEKIIQKASFYVPTQNLSDGLAKLLEHHFLIVSGEPGIGKTTISYLLICDMLANGHELIYVDDQLKDAEDVLSRSPEVKHVIFFDDFLGANLSEIINPRNSESKIVSFIERIKASRNSYLVMTTRTTILRQAEYRFEKFNRSGYADLSNYELEIKFYSKLDKAKILYNHLFHSGMAPERYDVFFQDQNYLKIVNHANYFPRLVEFITLKERLRLLPADETEDFIFKSLNNPKEIWHFAYDQQLGEEDQFLLMTLFSLGGFRVEDRMLEKAFEKRYAYEIRENGHVLKTDAYQRALKKLLDGFIRSERDDDDGCVRFSYLNPSVGDFVINYLRERYQESKRILNSAAYFRQINGYFGPGLTELIQLSEEQLKEYYPHFNRLVPELVANADSHSGGQITVLYMLLNFFPESIEEYRLLGILEDIVDIIEDENILHWELSSVLSLLGKYESTKVYINNHWMPFFKALIDASVDNIDIGNALKTLEEYDLCEEIWGTADKFVTFLKTRINEMYSADEIDLSSNEERIYNTYYSGSPERAWDLISNRVAEDYAGFLNDCGLSNFYEDFYKDADIDQGQILESFITNYSDHDNYDPTKRIMPSPEEFDENAAIRRLFER